MRDGYFIDSDCGTGEYREIAWFLHEGDADDFLVICQAGDGTFRKRPASPVSLVIDNETVPVARALH